MVLKKESRVCYMVILLIMLLLHSQNNFAQKELTKYLGLRIGADLAEILVTGAESGKTAYMFSIDYEYKPKRFAALDIGGLILDDTNDTLSHKINGYYGLVGIDLNGLKNDISNDVLHYGLRYGFSLFSHDISKQESYIDDFDGVGKESLAAHWAEAVAGAKAELWFLKNLYVGLSFRAKFLISRTKDKSLAPAMIPGYGDPSKGANFDVNWTLSYKIPFRKVTVTIEDKKKKKE